MATSLQMYRDFAAWVGGLCGLRASAAENGLFSPLGEWCHGSIMKDRSLVFRWFTQEHSVDEAVRTATGILLIEV